MSSTPRFRDFIPTPPQYDLLHALNKQFDYSLGTHEVLCSGSVGSSKSVGAAHAIVDHCINYPGAVMGIGRLALPHLKRTLCQTIRKHLYNIGGGLDFKYYEVSGDFKFSNGSQIYAMSWKDGNYTKLGSYEYSSFVVEELTENKGKHEEAYKTITERVGRLKIPQKFILSLTNPDSPSHWAYKYFIQGASDTRHVFYSVTTDNYHLPKTYIKNLAETLDPKMYRRKVKGEWLEIRDEVIYYQYSSDNRINKKYVVNPNYPIIMSCDFNIGYQKPMSYVFMQHIHGVTHIYGEVIIDGARTREAVIEAAEKGLLSGSRYILVHGDANGWAGNVMVEGCPYDEISKALKDLRLVYDIEAPRKNPEIKVRHNIMNGRIKNHLGQVKLFVYDGAETVDEGLRLTALKPGASFLEDDSKRYQHCTTAIGYSVCLDHLKSLSTPGDVMGEISKYS